jgi:hypothetical protein
MRDVIGNEVMQDERTLQLAFFSFLDRGKAYHRLCVGDVQRGIRELSTYTERGISTVKDLKLVTKREKSGFVPRRLARHGRKTDKGPRYQTPDISKASWSCMDGRELRWQCISEARQLEDMQGGMIVASRELHHSLVSRFTPLHETQCNHMIQKDREVGVSNTSISGVVSH